MARTPDGPPPPPAVQKLRVRYAKRGRLRFTSHRDIQRSLERALRRADIPMAYSAGFSPHPKVSYAGAAPTGTASEAEYLEISVSVRCDPAAVRAALDESMPPGLDVLEVVEAGPGNLVERLQASAWRIELPGVADEPARAAVATFLAAAEVPVQRMMKNGLRTFDTRGAVHTLTVRRPGRSGGRPGGRPGCEPGRRSGTDARVVSRRGVAVRYCERSYGTPHPPYAPTTSSPRCAWWPTSCRRQRLA